MRSGDRPSSHATIELCHRWQHRSHVFTLSCHPCFFASWFSISTHVSSSVSSSTCVHVYKGTSVSRYSCHVVCFSLLSIGTSETSQKLSKLLLFPPLDVEIEEFCEGIGTFVPEDSIMCCC